MRTTIPPLVIRASHEMRLNYCTSHIYERARNSRVAVHRVWIAMALQAEILHEFQPLLEDMPHEVSVYAQGLV